MNASVENACLFEIWRLSILVYTPAEQISLDTKLLVGWIHVFEFISILLYMAIAIFCHILIVNNSKLKVMHNNLKVFFHHEFCASYFVQVTRSVLFLCAFSAQFQDVSIFGPLKILYVLREAGLMIGASAYAELTIDRILATINPEHYEQQRRPVISCILIIVMYIYVAIIETLRYNGTMSMIFMPLLLAAVSLFCLPCLIWVYKKNRYYLNSKYSLSLNKKFQIRENIRICLVLVPGAFGFCLCIIMFASIYFLVYIMEENHNYEASLLLTTSFNTGLQILFIISATTFTFGIPEMREQALNFLCGRPMTLRIQKVTPMKADQNVYFDQLKTMWATPTSAKIMPKR